MRFIPFDARIGDVGRKLTIEGAELTECAIHSSCTEDGRCGFRHAGNSLTHQGAAAGVRLDPPLQEPIIEDERELPSPASGAAVGDDSRRR